MDAVTLIEKTPKTFNARFEKEVFWAIADLVAAKYGRDKTEAVGRAILEAKGRLSAPVMTPVGVVNPANLPRLQAPNPAPQPVGFPVDCRHCGERTTGPTKFATICFGCKSSGHSNTPSECPVCTDGAAI